MNWETILGILTNPAVTGVLFAVAAIAIKGFASKKKLVTEILDIPRSVIAARKPNSPGGKAITEAEYAQIGKEIVDVAQEYGALKGLTQ